MPNRDDLFRHELAARLRAIAERRLNVADARLIAPFLELYYARAPAADLTARDDDALFAAAFAHFRLAQARARGGVAVRVCNPRPEEDGWRSEHTVVDVVLDDVPFLVDSVINEFLRRGLAVRFLTHPVIRVARDESGAVVACGGGGGDGGAAESFIHFEIGRLPESAHPELARGVESVLADVRAAVSDVGAVRAMVSEAACALAAAGLPEEEAHELGAFLDWLLEGNFTFLGARRYRFGRDGSAQITAEIEDEARLGVLRDPAVLVFDDLVDGRPLPPAARAFAAGPLALLVTKANRRSTVHRSAPMDVIVVKRWSGGVPDGAWLFAGLFGSQAYTRSARSIPLVRRNIAKVLERSAVDPRSHDGRALINILETFPRDELFQVDEAYLFDVSHDLLELRHRSRVALFVRHDDLDRTISCLVYLPRDRFTTELRLTVQRILERALDADVTAHNTQVADAPLARLQVSLRARGAVPPYERQALEAEIAAAARGWADLLQSALIAACGEEEGARLNRAYGAAFPAGYRERFTVDHAVSDIAAIEGALASGEIGLALYRPFAAAPHQMRFKIFLPDRLAPLSTVSPMLEHLGLTVIDESSTEVGVEQSAGAKRAAFIQDFGVETESGVAIDLADVRNRFLDAFREVWRGATESDRLNGLIIAAGLDWRQVMVIRAFVRYLRQVGIPFTQGYIEGVLLRRAAIAGDLVRLFEAQFDPGIEDRETRAEALRAGIASALDEVTSADEDRILRRVLNLVDVSLRTNAFQTDAGGERKPYISVKFDSSRIEDLPSPRPAFEVFVYSPRMEGVHLRGGHVARGGIRWSDRREDFRTEILGLIKAQTVKNAVIVPVGAKGGFVLKRPPDPADRAAFTAEGVACYQTLIRGLLDVTDTIREGVVAPPSRVVRRDGDDPYLVVAADKGTAAFSDIANAVAAEYGFWLGDAFASGGSFGYDHKAMGITARGAWESVKRHFREKGRDVQTEPFTVVGVGDMSGDVFGNGMLLSRTIRLLGAFDHRHVFVDPDPDPETSWAERARLFALPQSSWADYAADKLSPGGAVFDRRAKRVSLSPQIRARFGFEGGQTTPAELIRGLLGAEVDLLWFGGVGAFVKAEDETHAEVGDRTNDAIRVNAAALRAQVVGEGANLGVTQLGRIEFARRGGRINTDSIDNSAGVDCSDHEVNLKILLDRLVDDGAMTVKQRNGLLVEMTGDVAELVLRDNILQTLAISLIEAEGPGALDSHGRLIRLLERQARLNRAVEFLPDEDALADRAAQRQGLTRPEIAVLFSYCKIWLTDALLKSDAPDDPHLARDALRYFPKAIRERFPERVAQHPLRRELVAMLVTNSLVNRMGMTFALEVAEKTGAKPVEVAKAYVIARDVFGARELWDEIEALGATLPHTAQVGLYCDVQRVLERGALWFLAHGGAPLDIAANVASFAAPVAAIASRIAEMAPPDVNERVRARAQRYARDGAPEPLATKITYLIVLASACDIIRLAATRGMAVDAVARLYFAVGEAFGFGWLRAQAEKMAGRTYWQRLATAALIEEFFTHQRDVAARVLSEDGLEPEAAIAAWSAGRANAVDRARAMLVDLKLAEQTDLSMLTVAARQLRTLIEA